MGCGYDSSIGSVVGSVEVLRRRRSASCYRFILKQTVPFQFLAQPCRAVEAVRAEAGSAGSLDVAVQVVDVQLSSPGRARCAGSSARRCAGPAWRASLRPTRRCPRTSPGTRKRRRAIGKVSADQLVSATSRWPRSRSAASTLHGLVDLVAQHLRPARVHRAMCCACSGNRRWRSATASANGRPASISRFHSGGQRAPGSPPWPRRRRRTTADTDSAGSSRPARRPGRIRPRRTASDSSVNCTASRGTQSRSQGAAIRPPRRGSSPHARQDSAGADPRPARHPQGGIRMPGPGQAGPAVLGVRVGELERG